MANAKAIILTDDDYEYLQSLIRQRTIQAQIVDRAKILIYKSQGNTNRTIADRLDVNINTVKLCIKKYQSGGIQAALFDAQRKGRPVEITDDAVAWIINLACHNSLASHHALNIGLHPILIEIFHGNRSCKEQQKQGHCHKENHLKPDGRM